MSSRGIFKVHSDINETLQNAMELCDWILDTQKESFLESPNKHHIYYKARVVKYGRYDADLQLKILNKRSV